MTGLSPVVSDEPEVDPASFRDPSGFVFRRAGIVHRQVNRSYQAAYEQFVDSGLCGDLMEQGWLIRHVELEPAPGVQSYKLLRPEQLPFVSYPYEWPFSALRDAALLTLRIQKRALKYGMSLKDASAYNIQFLDAASRS